MTFPNPAPKLTTKLTAKFVKLSAFLALSGFTFGAAYYAPEAHGPVAELVKLNLKFDGAKTCSNASCHGGTEPGESPHGLNTYTLWSGKDPHRGAFDVLSNDVSKGIAGKLSIADATASERCLSCHATHVPDNLKGKDFVMEEGNSCGTCHGPSEKYLPAHSSKGWTEEQRKAAGAPAFGYEDKLLAATGVYDTKSLVFRAERCASCHLAIEADLVKSGHPTPYFELDYFSNPDVYQDRHWKDLKEPYFNTRQWASGQIVAVRDSMRQLAMRASGGADDAAVNDAWQQAQSHVHALAAWGPNDAVTKGMAVKPGDKAAIAAAATATAEAAEKLFPTIAALKPTKADTLKAAAALAADSELPKLGIHGVEQQAYGLYALYGAYLTTEGMKKDGDPVNDSIFKLFTPLDKATKGKMDGYDDALKEVAGKLPK